MLKLFDSCTSQTGLSVAFLLTCCRERSSRVQISNLHFYFLKVLFSEQSYRFISETFSIEFSGLHYCLFVKVLRVLV